VKGSEEIPKITLLSENRIRFGAKTGAGVRRRRTRHLVVGFPITHQREAQARWQALSKRQTALRHRALPAPLDAP